MYNGQSQVPASNMTEEIELSEFGKIQIKAPNTTLETELIGHSNCSFTIDFEFIISFDSGFEN